MNRDCIYILIATLLISLGHVASSRSNRAPTEHYVAPLRGYDHVMVDELRGSISHVTGCYVAAEAASVDSIVGNYATAGSCVAGWLSQNN